MASKGLKARDLLDLKDGDKEALRAKLKDDKNIVMNHACRLWRLDLTTEYPRIWIASLRGRIAVHVLSFFLRTGRIATGNNKVSHLCGQPRCCNVNHIVIEPQKVNMARTMC